MQKELFYPTDTATHSDWYTVNEFTKEIQECDITSPDFPEAYNVGYVSPDIVPAAYKISKRERNGNAITVSNTYTKKEYVDVYYSAYPNIQGGPAERFAFYNDNVNEWTNGYQYLSSSSSGSSRPQRFPNKLDVKGISFNGNSVQMVFYFFDDNHRYGPFKNFHAHMNVSLPLLKQLIEEDAEFPLSFCDEFSRSGASRINVSVKPSDFTENGYTETEGTYSSSGFKIKGVVVCMGLYEYRPNPDAWAGKNWSDNRANFSSDVRATYVLSTENDDQYTCGLLYIPNLAGYYTYVTNNVMPGYVGVNDSTSLGSDTIPGGFSAQIDDVTRASDGYVLCDHAVYLNNYNQSVGGRFYIGWSFEEIFHTMSLQPRIYVDSDFSTHTYAYGTNLHVAYPEQIGYEFTGNYITTNDPDDEKLADWQKSNDIKSKNDYNTEKDKPEYEEDRPVPKPDPNPVLPVTPGFSLAAAGSLTYAMTQDDFFEMWDDVYGRDKGDWKDLIEGLALFGSNPLNAILSYRWFPFTLRATDSVSSVVLGNTVVDGGHKYPLVLPTTAFYSMGGNFWYGKEKNFINSKHCKCRMWLPFYGYAELPMSQVLSKELEIKFQYNAPDDLGVWIISFGNVIYDYYECAPYIEIPITGDNSRAISIAKQQQAVNTALTIGAAAVTIGAGIAAGAATGGFGLIADAFSGGLGAGVDILTHAAAYGIPASEMVGIATGLGAIGSGIGTAAKAGAGIVNGITSTANQVGTLSTNVPTKAGASATTFLHMPMKPYIQFYTNETMETANIKEYKKTVGIACEQWNTIDDMPENSLLVISHPVFDTSGMTQNEQNALINALNGFYK